MSDTTEDLITFSPRAPSPSKPSPMLSYTQPDATPNAVAVATAEASQVELPQHSDSVGAGSSGPDSQVTASQDNKMKRCQYRSVVVIGPLPGHITKRDVLCRVSGGKVISCILTRLSGSLLAVVNLEDPASARHYVEFCAESFNKEIWTFDSGPDSVPFSHVEVTAHVDIFTNAPGLGDTWNSEDIPGSLKFYPSTTTRCLCLEDCPVERVAGIWAKLGLAHSEHLRNQLDDMWLDGARWNDATRTSFGTLHIWYSDIKSALEAQRRYPGLKFEEDPCSIMPLETFILGIGKSDDTYIDIHSYPFVSVLNLHRMSLLVEVIRGVLDPYEVFWGIQAPQPVEEKLDPQDLTKRLIHVLRMHVDGHEDIPRKGTQSRVLHPPHGFAFRPPSGLEDPFVDDYMQSPINSMPSQPVPRHTNSIEPQSALPSGKIHEPTRVPQSTSTLQLGPGHLARHIANLNWQYQRQRPGPRCTNTVAPQNPAHEDSSPQSGPSSSTPLSLAVSKSSTGSALSSSNDTPRTTPNYSRENWGCGRRHEDVFWTVDLEEFRAMDDDQWKAFGTSFYIPPAGFDTVEKHVVPLE